MVSCSKDFRLGMREMELAKWCCILTGAFAKPYASYSASFVNCGACARRFNGFVITM